MLKGATHNLYRGGPEDYSAWTRDINALDPDLLLLQESCDPARYTYPSALWAPVEANRCGSAIHLKHGQAVEVSLPAELRGWVIGAEVRELAWYPASPGALYVFSLHAPDRPSHNYEREVNAILDAIAPLVAGHTVIIGGDFNLTVSARHGSEERRNTSGEEAIHRRLREEFGLINCWQTLHPDEALQQTFRRYFSDDPQPFHIDGLFVPAAWQPLLKSCEVFNGPAWRGVPNSDHFPILATFAP